MKACSQEVPERLRLGYPFGQRSEDRGQRTEGRERCQPVLTNRRCHDCGKDSDARDVCISPRSRRSLEKRERADNPRPTDISGSPSFDENSTRTEDFFPSDRVPIDKSLNARPATDRMLDLPYFKDTLGCGFDLAPPYGKTGCDDPKCDQRRRQPYQSMPGGSTACRVIIRFDFSESPKTHFR